MATVNLHNEIASLKSQLEAAQRSLEAVTQERNEIRGKLGNARGAAGVLIHENGRKHAENATLITALRQADSQLTEWIEELSGGRADWDLAATQTSTFQHVQHELEVWLCPVHESLDKAGQLKPLDNCVACQRVQRDELQAEIARQASALEAAHQQTKELQDRIDDIEELALPDFKPHVTHADLMKELRAWDAHSTANIQRRAELEAAQRSLEAVTRERDGARAVIDQQNADHMEHVELSLKLERQNATLITALRQIANHKVEAFDHSPEEWAKHTPETCEECKRWRDMKHPLQHSCNGWYRLLHSRERRNDQDQANQHYSMRRIARTALAGEDQPSPQLATLLCSQCRGNCWIYPDGQGSRELCPSCNGTGRAAQPGQKEPQG